MNIREMLEQDEKARFSLHAQFSAETRGRRVEEG